MVTWAGSMIVESTRMNTACLPRQSILDSAYATGTLDTTTPIDASPA